MDEEAAVMLILAFWALLAFAVYQRFWVIRRLRNKLDKIADAAIEAVRPAAPKQALGPAQSEVGELRRIQERLRVLERIAVEKENSLSREIDELRIAQG
jgi:hypothetical protein